MHQKLILAAALALALPLAHAQADPACSSACASLVGEGQALAVQGKPREAMAKFQAAATAAPKASLPLAAAAHVYQTLAENAPPEQAAAARKQAAGFAQAALALSPTDPLALEVRRSLSDAAPSPLHVPNAAASKPLNEAEVLFARHDYPAALEKYQQAMQLDPAFSGAWVGAGDCWYGQNEWAKAEPLYRRATEIEPRNAQAWRFLSDAVGRQGKLAEADSALLAAIAAGPSQLPSWNKLTSLRRLADHPLKPLGLRRGASVAFDADGKATIGIDGDLQKSSPAPDNGVRLALALAEANARDPKKGPVRTPYAVELQAWQLALKVADESGAATSTKLSDPALLAMQQMNRDGQLEPAIFILLYRESYRPEFERWLAAHPDGVKTFIDRYGLRP